VRRRAVTLAAFAVVAAATAVVVTGAPDQSLAGQGAGELVLAIGAATFAVVAAAFPWRPVLAPLLAAAAAAWLAAEWASPGAGALFTAGLLLTAAWPPLLAAAALRGLAERPLDRTGRALVGAGIVIGPGLLGLASAVVFDPAAQGCSACPANLIAVASAPGAVRAFGHAGLALATAWAAAFCLLAAARLWRASPAGRRLAAPLLAPAAVAIAAFGADAAHGLARGFVSSDPTDRALRLVEAAAFAALGARIAIDRVRQRQTRARVARVVREIGAAPEPGGLEAQLAAALGDPGIALLHAVDGSWTDGAGLPAVLPDDRSVTFVRADGADVLAVVHRPGLLDDPRVVDELATTARLAVEHERLRAAHGARLAELRASRERIVAAADRERQALERDLHDGAQQRLVTLALSIRLVRRAGEDIGLAAAEEHVRNAVAGLREVAHGLFPAVLADEGLGPAIDALSEGEPRLIVHGLPTPRAPARVESAAYFAVLEALRATDRAVVCDLDRRDGSLRLRIAAGELGAALVGIGDRAGAVGGSATASDGELIVELPCAS
jgi:signal transduction histidine kinase